MIDYVEIEQNRIKKVLKTNRVKPPKLARFMTVDITGMSPMPKKGDIYDPNTGTFSTPEVNEFYLHASIADGDGKDPIGVKNDGLDRLTVTIYFRETGSHASTAIPVNENFRTIIRDDKGYIYDIINIKFHKGRAKFEYTTTNSPDKCYILEKDFTTIKSGGKVYTLRLSEPIEFIVYRDVEEVP